jgi:DNA polymerase-3 subunit delta
MATTLSSLTTDVKNGQLSSVYLIQVSDQYLMDQVRQLFSSLISDEDKLMNFAQFDMRETPLGSAVDDARSVPFFGDRRVVFIQNAYFLTAENPRTKIEHHVEDLIAYVQHPEPQTILVIFAPFEKLDSRKKITKLLKEQAEYLSFGEITEADVRGLIKEKLSSAGYSIQPSAEQLLIRLTNMSLTQIMSELDKLMLYAVDTKNITEDVVNALVSRTLGENIFDLIDALLSRKLTKAVQLYHELLLSGEEPLRLHGALIGQFRLLLQVKTATSSEQGTAKALGVHAYRVKLAKQTVRRFNYAALSKAYLGLVNMEEQLKFSTRDPELLFELFVLRYQAEIA